MKDGYTEVTIYEENLPLEEDVGLIVLTILRNTRKPVVVYFGDPDDESDEPIVVNMKGQFNRKGAGR